MKSKSFSAMVAIVAVVLCFFSYTSVFSIPAYPKPILFTQPDGSQLTILLKGDEKVKWAQTTDGYTIMFNKYGTYEFATLDDNSEMVPSGFKAYDISQRPIETIDFLTKITKGLYYSKLQVASMKSIWDVYKGGDKAFPTTGNRKLICILIGYSDRAFSKTQAEYNNLFNQIGYTTDGATGSVKDCYLENSYNQFTLTVDVVGPYTAANTLNYYGENDEFGDDMYPRELVTEAVTLADADVNFADYDNDNNGSVDGVYVIYAGYGEASGAPANTIWPHAWSIPTVTKDGKTISKYSCSSELRGTAGTGITRIGVICHEFGHVLGAPDYYDTDYETGGEFEGTGDWDMMAGGSWNNGGATPAHHNAYTKVYKYNWATATTLTYGSNITLYNAAENSNSFYRFNTTTTNEYYLIENRQKVKFDASIPGHGMIIYHVHANIAYYSINATHPQMMYPVYANASSNPTATPSSYGVINDGGCPFPGTGNKTSFTDATTPWAKSWAGDNTAKPITLISENNTNKTISFAFMGGAAAPVANFSGAPTTICAGKTVTYTDLSTNGPTSWLWSFPGGTPTSSTLQHPTITYNIAGTYNASLTATNSNGANATSKSNYITVNALPVASAGSDKTICAGSITTLTATGGTSYTWSSGSTEASETVSPLITTSYSVTIANASGCTTSDFAIVVVNPLPTANAGMDRTICAGTSTTLTATGGTSYTWNTTTTTPTLTVSPMVNTTYTVTVTSASGCSASDNAIISVNPVPIANAGPDQTISSGQSANLTASGGIAYTWSNGSSTASITVSPLITTTYSVTAANASGCTASDNVVVNVPAGSLPTIAATNPITTITTNSAVSGGKVTSVGGSAVTAIGVCWATTSNPTISNSKTINGSGAGSFTSNITGLLNNTVYYVRAYATNSAGTAYGSQVYFKTGAPNVTTNAITGVNVSVAIAGGTVLDNGSAITTRGVCYGTSSNPTTSNSRVAATAASGAFTCNLTGLTPGTYYYVRAYAANARGTAYGNQVTFRAGAPILAATTGATNITGSTATSGGNISSDGGSAVTARGVCWNTAANPTIANSKTIDGTGIGTFTSNLSGLIPGRLYYASAYATNANGTTYGTQVAFYAGLPQMTTTVLNNITMTTAISGGTISTTGGENVTARGVCWGTSSLPTIANNKTVDGTGIGTFTSNITGLTDSTIYYLRAYATTLNGTSYGNQIVFKTGVPILSTTAATSITSTTAISGGNITSDCGRAVTARGICWSTKSYPTTANSKIGSGTGIGTFECNITGLTPGVKYYVRSFAVNSIGTAYGKQINFITTTSKSSRIASVSNENGTINFATNDEKAKFNVYPNPFKDQTTISIDIKDNEHAIVGIYDANGKLVSTLLNGNQDIGNKIVTWDGKDDRGNLLPYGTYFCKFISGKQIQTKKLLFVK